MSVNSRLKATAKQSHNDATNSDIAPDSNSSIVNFKDEIISVVGKVVLNLMTIDDPSEIRSECIVRY